MIAVDDLAAAQQPVRQELIRRGRFGEQVLILRFGHGGPCVIPQVHRLLDVAVKLLPMPQEPPVLHAMARCAQRHARALRLHQQIAHDVPVRAHFRRVPVGQLAPVVLESVVMLRHRHDVIRPRFPEQLHPRLRIERFHLELRNKILEPEILRLPVMLAVVLILRRTLDVHVPRVPIMIRRNRKHAPVQEDTQPFLPIPVRHRVGAERFPRRVIFSRCVHRVDFLQITLPIHCVLLSKMKRMNSLLKEYDKQVKNPCAKAKKCPKTFPKIRAISPNACFFLTSQSFS